MSGPETTRMEYSMQMLPLCYCYTKYREEIRDSLRRNVTKGDFALGWDDIRMYSKTPTFFFFFEKILYRIYYILCIAWYAKSATFNKIAVSNGTSQKQGSHHRSFRSKDRRNGHNAMLVSTYGPDTWRTPKYTPG